MSIEPEMLRLLVEPVLEQDGKAYVAVGCGKVFVASFPAETCKACKSEHTNYLVQSLQDLELIPLDYP